ncbi:MAG: peroxiredoxin [Ignavibacteria bacterium]|nr:peroxiredoxin [Ignavibacteria bacterium]
MALSPGTLAPVFTLVNQNKEPISLSAYRGRNVILVFYPAAFSGVCDAEVCAFQNALGRLNSADADVIGISPDTPFSNRMFREINNLNFPLLSDLNLDTIKAYDIVFENFAGIQGFTRCQRATFILDRDGIIRYVNVTPSPGVEPNYDEIFAAVEAVEA